MVSLDNFFFFLFSSDVTKQLRWWNLWDQILVPALPCSQLLTEWIMHPLCWSDHLCALLPPWKERKLCFAADLAIWNSSHHPFLGLKLLSLKVPSHCALYRLVLEKSWQVYVQNFKIFILFWNSASLELRHTGHPSACESSLQSVGSQCADLLKFLSLPNPPFLMRFQWGLVGVHTAA